VGWVTRPAGSEAYHPRDGTPFRGHVPNIDVFVLATALARRTVHDHGRWHKISKGALNPAPDFFSVQVGNAFKRRDNHMRAYLGRRTAKARLERCDDAVSDQAVERGVDIAPDPPFSAH
jgi:hypothetical protein